MPDSPETKVLKDINRHLANIDEDAGGPAESTTDSLKVLGGVVDNFERLLDAKLQRVVLTSERAFNRAFGNLEGFNADQTDNMIAELDNVIDELKINNRLAMKSDDLNFLKEKEREEEVKINKETNEILEDILEKDEGGGGGKEGGITGMPLEIIGGLLTALGLKGLGAKIFSKAGMIGLGKFLAKSVFAAFSLKNFFEGFMEDKDDEGKTFAERFVSGLGNMIEALSFGLISDEVIEKLGAVVKKKFSDAGEKFQKAWDKYWEGGMPLSDALAEAFAALSLGTLSPEAVKRIGESIKFFVDSLGDAVISTVLGVMGFDVKRFKLSPEAKERLAKQKEIREKIRKEFKFKQQIEPELERLFEEAGLSSTRKTNLRNILGGKLALYSPGELRQFDEDERDLKQAQRTKDREEFLAIQTKSLKEKIEREKWLEERRKKELKAKEAKDATAALQQVGIAKELEERIRIERGITDTEKRLGKNAGTQINNNTVNSVSQPDQSTENVDLINTQRTVEATTGLYGLR